LALATKLRGLEVVVDEAELAVLDEGFVVAVVAVAAERGDMGGELAA
jgi:hypothetical protein